MYVSPNAQLLTNARKVLVTKTVSTNIACIVRRRKVDAPRTGSPCMQAFLH